MEEEKTTLVTTGSGKTMNLNTALGLRESKESVAKNAIQDNLNKFKKNQGIFKGERKTFNARPGCPDIETQRSHVLTESTVMEQLAYMQETLEGFMKIAFSAERTNASGNAKAELIVDNVNWGEFTSLELLRLKTFLDNHNLRNVYATIPVRSGKELWAPTRDEDYSNKEDIFETVMMRGETRTTHKESYILDDPNPNADKRPPQVAQKTTLVITGDTTSQKFSGEMTKPQRADILGRYDILKEAVKMALSVANNTDVIESNLGEKVFDFLHGA